MKNLFATILLLLTVEAMAQEKKDEKKPEFTPYKFAIGGKWSPASLSVKYFLTKQNCLEGQVAILLGGPRVTVLYEIHKPIKAIPGIRWYFGPGVHVGVAGRKFAAVEKVPAGFGAGVDGVIGVDYKFENLPINISLDWQPSLYLINTVIPDAGYGGLAIRYVIK